MQDGERTARTRDRSGTDEKSTSDGSKPCVHRRTSWLQVWLVNGRKNEHLHIAGETKMSAELFRKAALMCIATGTVKD